jgi:predicted O-linked N-acetylglucosamine transferase (SPINDLY family)
MSSLAHVRPAAAGPQAPFERGLAHAARREWRDAASCFELAARAQPTDPVAWLNLARACLHEGRHDAGADAARAALGLQPGSALALDLALQCLGASRRDRELVALCEAFDMGAITDARLHLVFGQSLARLWRHQDAIGALFEALRRDPALLDAHIELAGEFQMIRMHEEARECFRTAASLAQRNVGFLSAVVFASLSSCSWATLEADIAQLRRAIDAGSGQPEPFYSLTLPTTREQQLAAMRHHWQRAFGGLSPLEAPAWRPAADGRIRVGYLSSDLHAHATAFLIAEVFEQHDRRLFDVFAYSYGDDDGSQMRRRLEGAFGPGRFLDAREMGDEQIARRIRDDGIEILVDLKGYTLLARNGILGFRPAPVQVNYLGFPGTLGSDRFDYIIGDRIVTPLAHEDGYAERIAQLPGCYQPNDRKRREVEPTPRSRWGLPEQALVLCSFNANYKITPAVFDAWCRLLGAIPDAILWIFESNAQARRNLLAEAARRGIGAERIFWAPGLTNSEHLARIRVADIFLDTLPVNAHTTASDALWAGVPVVTVLGETFVSRVAASILHAAGLPELVAEDLAGYERIVLDLARDRDRLRALRRRLEAGRGDCVLFDSERTTRGLEDLFRQMSQRQRAGLPPAHLPARDPALR